MSSCIPDDLFSPDDLFITVRNTRLRAFNRLVLAANYHQSSPRLARLYLRYVEDIDPQARLHLEKMRRRIAAQGIAAVRRELKYCLNPYDPSIDQGMTLPQFLLWQSMGQAQPARIEWL